jgi:hypothetical protein
MIDHDFSGADHVVDDQDASSYHFINANNPSTIQHQKEPLDHRNKTTCNPFQNGRQVYQPPLAPFSANESFYSPDTQQRSYDNVYPATISTAADTTDGSQAFYTPGMAPIARTGSETSEQGSSAAEGLSEALGELKIDESGTGRHSLELVGDITC